LDSSFEKKKKKKKIFHFYDEFTCLFAGCPTNLWPSSVKATTEGVVRAPSEFSITRGSEPSITATQLFVVPRSIPIISEAIPLLSKKKKKKKKTNEGVFF
jgi:hypothetical protein